MGRPTWYDVKGNKKGEWTADEDRKLVAYITQHGLGDWRLLPKRAGLERCGKSCRLRWLNYLRHGIKRGKFTPKEEEDIIKFHGLLGNRWAAIARQMPNRTDNDIKNHWNSCLRKRLAKSGIDPMTHQRMIHDPMIYEQMIHEPTMTHEPIIQVPMTHVPIIQEPVTNEPIIQEPMIHEPMTHESMIQEPVIPTIEATSSSTVSSSTPSPRPSPSSSFSSSSSSSARLLNKLASRRHDLDRLIKNVILSKPSSSNNNGQAVEKKMISNEEEEAMMNCFMEIINENLISTSSFDDLSWDSFTTTASGFAGLFDHYSSSIMDPYGLSQSNLYDETGPLDVFHL